MTLAEIAAVMAEAVPLLEGGSVVRVREPMADHLAFEIRHRGRNLELLFGVADGLARVHLAANLPPTPPNPGPLTLQARKRMKPGRVTALSQRPGDRVVMLTVSQHRDEQGPWSTTLVAELFGRGRLLLLDGAHRLLSWRGPGGARGLVRGEPYQPPQGAGETPDPAPIDSATLEARYEAWWRQQGGGDAARRAAREHRRECQRIARRIAAMERDLAAMKKWEAVMREAELLAGHRHLLSRGMDSVTVNDWFDPANPERVIALDPALSAEENVAARFKKAKRARGGMAPLQARIERDRETLARLEAAGPVVAEAEEASPSQDKKSAGFRYFQSVEGWRVYVGRSAGDNDRLTFRMANGNDLWFHARDTPGSHVVLRGGGGEPPRRAIHDAARLAAYYSKLKQAGGGEVMYAHRKYLKRPKGGRPGQVLVTQERVLDINLDQEDMTELLATKSTA